MVPQRNSTTSLTLSQEPRRTHPIQSATAGQGSINQVNCSSEDRDQDGFSREDDTSHADEGSDYAPSSSVGAGDVAGLTGRRSSAVLPNDQQHSEDAQAKYFCPTAVNQQRRMTTNKRKRSQGAHHAKYSVVKDSRNDVDQRGGYPVQYLMGEMARLETGESDKEAKKREEKGPKIVLLPMISRMNCEREICNDPTNAENEYRLRVHSRQKKGKTTRASKPTIDSSILNSDRLIVEQSYHVSCFENLYNPSKLGFARLLTVGNLQHEILDAGAEELVKGWKKAVQPPRHTEALRDALLEISRKWPLDSASGSGSNIKSQKSTTSSHTRQASSASRFSAAHTPSSAIMSPFSEMSQKSPARNKDDVTELPLEPVALSIFEDLKDGSDIVKMEEAVYLTTIMHSFHDFGSPTLDALSVVLDRWSQQKKICPLVSPLSSEYTSGLSMLQTKRDPNENKDCPMIRRLQMVRRLWDRPDKNHLQEKPVDTVPESPKDVFVDPVQKPPSKPQVKSKQQKPSIDEERHVPTSPNKPQQNSKRRSKQGQKPTSHKKDPVRKPRGRPPRKPEPNHQPEQQLKANTSDLSTSQSTTFLDDNDILVIQRHTGRPIKCGAVFCTEKINSRGFNYKLAKVDVTSMGSPCM
ncbi:MAG: hypothetical protein Q9164_005453 [Protoblastenia rupestris]